MAWFVVKNTKIIICFENITFNFILVEGAWWLGEIMIGIMTFLFAILIVMFPKHLPIKKKSVEPESENVELDHMNSEKIEDKHIEETEESAKLKG